MFYLGITQQKSLFRVAVIRKDRRGLIVDSLHSFPYGQDHVKLFYNLPPFHKGKASIASGLSCQDLLIRKLHLPLSNKAKILKTLPFQLESLLPFAEKTSLVCAQLKVLSRQMTSVTLLTTTENKVREHLDGLLTLEIKPDRVSCSPAALLRLSHYLFPKEPKILCLDTREEIVTCVLIEGGEIALAQSLSTEADPLALEKLAQFLKQKGAIDDQTPWMLMGERLEKEKIQALFSGKQLVAELEPEYALAIGLALDAAIDNEFSIQFCQKHLAPTHITQKRRNQLLSYGACCLSAALIVFVSGSLLIGKKEILLAKELKTYYPSAQTLSSVKDMEECLISWESSLKGKTHTFSLVPNVPKVSDLLAYLSAHPSLTTNEGEQAAEVEIKSVHYSLAKYPKIGEPSVPYTAQVDLEFTAPTPRIARDFHEALLKGDALVNSKKEIKWQSQNQTYLTSFELNKGVFP